ncbi:hypothetical protein [Sphingopyxis sp. LK2115]|uniref:hypothetical protein n=1 Tax=Sphingopyxis sp. LK2115 TaxID=2744558 RepID=UPI001CB6E223|nr:hypothetical protein [Sphingopyxis sp. LK2115]
MDHPFRWMTGAGTSRPLHHHAAVAAVSAPTTMRVFIPLTIRKRNGRPKIVPPADMAPDTGGGVDPHVLKAIAKAWSWRRKLESGESATIQDIADAEGISDRYVGRMLRLAYLAPAVLDKLLIGRVPPSVSIKDLAQAAELPWIEQVAAMFG